MITHVAIKYEGKLYSLPRPNRHHHIIHQIHLETGHHDIYGDQGFLDDQGNFLSRAEALIHAQACGQEFTKHPLWDDWLYSENVW